MNRLQIKQALQLAKEIDNAGSPLPCYREAAALLRTLAEVAQENKGDTTTKTQYRRMFLAACDALGLVNEALGLDPPGWKLAPNEPTPEIIAAAALAVWPAATARDLELARQAARIVLEQTVFDVMPGASLDTLAATMATMAPAYRAMLASAPQPPRTSTSTHQAAQLLRLIADDAYAASFQSLGQYRTALLKFYAKED